MLGKYLKAFAQSDFGIALAITLVWKILLIAIGFASNPESLLAHTMNWDAGWYMTILSGWYGDHTASAAFYPLYPLLVQTVHLLSFGFVDYPLAGQVVNTIAVWLIITALLKLSRKLLGDRRRFWLVALVLSAPAAFFMHVFYGEAVFMAIAFWAYYFALNRSWLKVGMLLAFLTAARLPSVLIIALCGLEYLRASNWNIRTAFNKNLLYFLLAPLGFISYMITLAIIQQDPIGMFHAYSATNDWAYHVFNPNIIETVLKAGYQILRVIAGVRPVDLGFIINILLPLLALASLVASSVYLFIKHRKTHLPLAITGVLAFVMFTLNSNIVSVHRYIMPLLGIYIAAALFIAMIKKPVILALICIIGFAVQIPLLILFAQDVFVG